MEKLEIYLFVGGNRNYMDEDIMMLLSFCGVTYFTFRYLLAVKRIIFICKSLSGRYYN